MLAMGLSCMAFVMLRCIPSIPNLLKVFIMKECKSLSDFFFCSYWDDSMTFIPHYVNVQYHIYSFVYVQLSLQPWDGSHLIAVYDSFIVLLNSAHLLGFFVFGFFFFFFFWEFLPSMFISILACDSLPLLCPCLILVPEYCWLCKMNLEVFLPFQFFGASLRWIGINSSLNVWVEFPSRTPWFCTFLLGGRFWIVKDS